jgi:hypothetical protein
MISGAKAAKQMRSIVRIDKSPLSSKVALFPSELREPFLMAERQARGRACVWAVGLTPPQPCGPHDGFRRP